VWPLESIARSADLLKELPVTSQDIKQVREAFQTACGKVKVEKTDLEAAVRVITPFMDRNGQPFLFYAYRRPRKKKIFLTDCGAIVLSLEKSGTDIQMALLQKMLRSYGMTLTQDKSVVEMTDRPLGQRVSAVFQAWAAADGILRMWTLPT
jgi:hypothetical protein